MYGSLFSNHNSELNLAESADHRLCRRLVERLDRILQIGHGDDGRFPRSTLWMKNKLMKGGGDPLLIMNLGP
jgi:hypothetical protein